MRAGWWADGIGDREFVATWGGNCTTKYGGCSVRTLIRKRRTASDPPVGRLAVTIRRLMLLAVTVLLIPGCMGLQNVLQVNVCEPEQYCVSSDRRATFERNRELACQAWACVVQADPSVCSAVDYMEGFVDGYADYLNLGGTGAAPPIPPRRYWNVDYRSPGGADAVQQWYAGFEHGAAEAKQSGYRELAVVPSSVLSPLPPPGSSAAAGPTAAPLGAAEVIGTPVGQSVVEPVPTPAPEPIPSR